MTTDPLRAACKDEARTVVNTGLPPSATWTLGAFKGVPTYAATHNGVTWIYARPADPTTAFYASANCRDCGTKRIWKVQNARQGAWVEGEAKRPCKPCAERIAARKPCDTCGQACDPGQLDNGLCAGCQAKAAEREAADLRAAARVADEGNRRRDALAAFRGASWPSVRDYTHCLACGGRLTDFDYAAAEPGYHFDCVGD